MQGQGLAPIRSPFVPPEVQVSMGARAQPGAGAANRGSAPWLVPQTTGRSGATTGWKGRTWTGPVGAEWCRGPAAFSGCGLAVVISGMDGQGVADGAAAEASGAPLAGGTGFTERCEPAVRAGAAGLRSRLTRPHQGMGAGSARTSSRLRASRPQAMATRWTVWP